MPVGIKVLMIDRQTDRGAVGLRVEALDRSRSLAHINPMLLLECTSMFSRGRQPC
jgi:hypothetical protein